MLVFPKRETYKNARLTVTNSWKYPHKKGRRSTTKPDCNEEERAAAVDAQIKFAAGGSTESQLNLSLAGSAVFCLIDLWYHTVM